MEHMLVYNTILGGLGKGYHRECGIPQGCPLSMMFLALLLRPWCIALEAKMVVPRILADDLMAFAEGRTHCNRIVDAINFTHKYLHDMGAVVAPTKSYIFSSDKGTRKFLTTFVWKHINTVIPVVMHGRDLGGQFNTLHKNIALTLNTRIENGISMLLRLRWLPISLKEKAKIIRTKIIPASLYGIECAQPNEQHMRTLQGAMADAMGCHSSRRANSLVFDLHSYGPDIDPCTHQFANRAVTFRSMWVKHPAYQEMARSIFRFYKEIDSHGTYQDQTKLASLTPAPPPATAGRKR